jgi:hypothetical protein
MAESEDMGRGEPKKGPDQENKISRALAVARVASISY